MRRNDSRSLKARLVHVGARRRLPYIGAQSCAGLLKVEDILRVAVRSVTRKTATIAAGREAPNHLATYLAGWS